MTSSIFLFLRRLRRPLLVLIFSYAAGTLGLVLIPGADAEGRPVHLDFLHAFYIVTYTGTTIGFGEIPYAFTPLQRLWMIVTIYVTVIAWVYSIGSIIATLQEPALRRVIAQRRFEREVRGIDQPFYLVCGHGDTGAMIVRELRRYGYAVVVLDIVMERLDELSLLDLGMPIPAFCYDASQPDNLVAAGLRHPRCIGVLGFTGSDEVNLAVAMAARLLNPRVPAICRSYSAETAANMASFGTRHIVNPFAVISERVRLAFRAPSALAIHDCLTSSYRTPVEPPLRMPRGHWVVCGHGRFGSAVVEQLLAAGNTVRVIEPDARRLPDLPGTVFGRGTEAPALLEAGIAEADGIVAGTDNGINNLSIVVTARELNPRVFTTARQVTQGERLLFKQAGLDLRVRLTYLAATEAVELLRNPLLPCFLDHLNECEEPWAAALLSRLAAVIGDASPTTWSVTLAPGSAPAPSAALAAGHPVTLGLLLRNPRTRARPLAAVALLLRREGRSIVLPDEELPLRPGDELLFCGLRHAEQRMCWALQNVDVLNYLATGAERPSGWVWRWLARRRGSGAQPRA
ncbi:potassium channel family protein [Caldimonas tepidiphila]|uniref:potassium channel family protein n=1 Tax=Caldimonas tepidiphila TaxID=2315841 RepID=UPI000E5BFB06|nr:NAD-binding protein [Caldimonas tepidiphila]